jgi:hypothetical protein
VTNMPIKGNAYSLTEDQAVDIGAEAFTDHIGHVEACYINKEIMRAYLCGCLGVISHWLITNAGGRQAFELLTEMAEMALKANLKEGD